MSENNYPEMPSEQSSSVSNLDRICGIDEQFIENKKEYESLINDMKCPMCLNVVCKPLECKLCQTLICENCFFVLHLAETPCITQNCKGNYSKANKFVREILCALKITCEACGKKGMNYTDYLKHIDSCEQYLANPLMKIIRDINEREEEIKKLTKEVETASENANVNLTPDEVRRQLVTTNLSVTGKMELYNACVSGKLNEFRNLIQNKKYPILEEISAKNYGWTPLHYAMHYGKFDVICYILDYLQDMGKYNLAMMLKSSDGRTPVLCLLRSNSLNIEQKKDILIKVFQRYVIPLTPELKTELKNRNCLQLIDYMRK